MNITLSVDEKLVSDARKIASEMGKSLNQLIREHLEQLTQQQKSAEDFDEFIALSGTGDSKGWTFNRDELYERT